MKIASPVIISLRYWAAALIALAAILPASGQSSRIALLVAVGDYPADSGWRPIHSQNDVDLIRHALENRGFAPEDIHILTDAQATKQGIQEAVRQILLDKARPGDVVYFQFSGHGQQVQDDNGDEVDGLDEAIVPINSPMRYQPGVYQGENLIRDDELDQWFTRLRQQLGPKGNLMVVLDACHSGTGTRGFDVARGTDVVMADPNRPAAGDRSRQGSFLSGDNAEAALAPMAAYFGAAHNQLNFETHDENGRPCGSLSFALARTLANAAPNASYRGLFEQVKVEMSKVAPRQNPQAEGTLDQEILGGRLLPKPDYYKVTAWNDDYSLVVNSGWVHGLYEGTVLGFYPAETRNIADRTPVAKGAITKAGPFSSIVALENAVPEASARSAWVYVLEQNFGSLQIGIGLKLPADHPFRPMFNEKIAKYPVIQYNDKPELYLHEDQGKMKITSGDGYAIEEVPSGVPAPVMADRLIRAILGYSRCNFIRGLEVNNPNLKLELEMIPIDVDERTLTEKAVLPKSGKTDAFGNVRYRVGDYFKLVVHNRGVKAAYFNILDIQPDNQFQPIVPRKDETSTEYRAGPLQSVEIPYFFKVFDPVGTEIFKLIASEEPIDLRPLANTRGQTRSNSNNPFEVLMQETYFPDEVMSRGGKTVNLASGSIHTHSVTFIIEK